MERKFTLGNNQCFREWNDTTHQTIEEQESHRQVHYRKTSDLCASIMKFLSLNMLIKSLRKGVETSVIQQVADTGEESGGGGTDTRKEGGGEGGRRLKQIERE